MSKSTPNPSGAIETKCSAQGSNPRKGNLSAFTQTILRKASAPHAQGTPVMVPQVTEEIPPNPGASGHGAGPARALQLDAPTSDAAAQDKILSAPREREQSLFAMFESLKAEGAVRQTNPEQCSSCGGSSPRERSETPRSLSEAELAPTPAASKAYELRFTDSDAALAGEERARDSIHDGAQHLRHASAIQKSYHRRSNFNNALVNAAHRNSRQIGGCLQPVGNEVESTVCGAAAAAPRSSTDPDLHAAEALSGNSALSSYRITPYQPGLRNPSASSAGSENVGTMSGIVNGIDVILPSNASSSLSSNRMLSSPWANIFAQTEDEAETKNESDAGRANLSNNSRFSSCICGCRAAMFVACASCAADLFTSCFG